MSEMDKSIQRGLDDSAAGRVHYLGSFATFGPCRVIGCDGGAMAGTPRCFDHRLLVCSGCGEAYQADQIEGTMHDHWTAAVE